VKNTPFNEPEIMFDLENASYKQNADLFHQAGYDAYQTGYAFLRMFYYLSKWA
jgi:hypothetical protein